MDRETRDMLLETADRFFTERCGRAVVNEVEKGVWPADLWKEIEEMGLPLIAVPEDKNGAGGTLADMLAVLRLAGSHALASRQALNRIPPMDFAFVCCSDSFGGASRTLLGPGQ